MYGADTYRILNSVVCWRGVGAGIVLFDAQVFMVLSSFSKHTIFRSGIVRTYELLLSTGTHSNLLSSVLSCYKYVGPNVHVVYTFKT
jgi:hypothetical protein